MKKTVLAAGVAAVMLAPVASADISWYGKAHMAVEHTDTAAGDDTDLVSRDSRLGFKAKTKISDGLEAIAGYEFGVDLDGNTGGGDFFIQRNHYLGLQGSFGRIHGGKFDTPLKKAEGKIDQFGDTFADIGRVLDNVIDSQERENSFLGYYSPKLGGGLKFAAATMKGSGNDFGDAFSVALYYGDPKHKKGNFYAAVAYDDGVDGDDRSVLRLAASAKFGNAFVGAIFENAEDDGAINDDHNRYVLSTHFKVGKGKIKAQYASADDIGAIAESDQVTVGYSHKLGGGTEVYAYHSQADLRGADVDTTALGMIYKF